MKTFLRLAALTIGVAVTVYLTTLFLETLPFRQANRNPDPALQWLRQELDLSEEQTRAVSRLQDAYRPSCQAMCRRILASDAKLKELLAKSSALTPEILAALAERDRLISDCRRAFMEHIYAVSRELSAHQRQRYLALVSEELLGLPPDASVPQRKERGR